MGDFALCMMLMWILCTLTPPTVPIENHILYTYCALTLEEGDAGVVMCHLNWHSKPQEQQDQLLKRPQTYPKLYFHT